VPAHVSAHRAIPANIGGVTLSKNVGATRPPVVMPATTHRRALRPVACTRYQRDAIHFVEFT
jgi:hypothetical protein